jgi:hypothetical protein
MTELEKLKLAVRLILHSITAILPGEIRDSITTKALTAIVNAESPELVELEVTAVLAEVKEYVNKQLGGVL